MFLFYLIGDVPQTQLALTAFSASLDRGPQKVLVVFFSLKEAQR